VKLGAWVCVFAALGALPVSAAGCSKKAEESETKATELPALDFRADTPNLMITWIDPQGGTHVESSPDKVPEAGRDFVRIVISDRPEGTTDPIYISDLTKPNEAGSFVARSSPRRVWEDEIDRRRKSGAVAEAPTDPPRDRRHDPPADRPPRPRSDNGPPSDQTARPNPNDPTSHVRVTVYGADWCGPCHEALAHLKKRGVAASFKDIDKDKVAQAEMSLKLQKVGRPGGRIPVIDVEGKILVGYSQRALDAALEEAGGGTAL
jgi:glutaredoxin